MAPRAIWKGTLTIAGLHCPVALHAATSAAERIALHVVDRTTGRRTRRQFVDSETEAPVEPDQQVKGYETAAGESVVLEPADIAAAIPAGDKTLTATAVLDCAEIDDLYFDRVYYLRPATSQATAQFKAIRAALMARQAAAVVRALLFRRVRTLLVRAHGDGMMAATLRFDDEVRAPDDAFGDIPALKSEREMLDLARHIIDAKAGSFDASDYQDRYEAALVALIEAKRAGKKIPPARRPAPAKRIDLLDALRQSAREPAKRRRSRG
jgi:DNA end-binding protein Ku